MSTNKVVWFQLVDQNGEPYKGTACGFVSMSPESVVHHFRDAVMAKNSVILPGIVSTQLLVYSNRKAFYQGNVPLRSSAPLDRLGETEDDALIVVVPSPLEPGWTIRSTK
jgi:5-formyltetrahydrofolate cyclo-ligase